MLHEMRVQGGHLVGNIHLSGMTESWIQLLYQQLSVSGR